MLFFSFYSFSYLHLKCFCTCVCVCSQRTISRGRGGGGGEGGAGGGGGSSAGIMSRDAGSSSSSNRYEIPSQLQQLVLDFTVICLVERPADLVEFAADYFAQLRQRQQQQREAGGGLSVAGSAAHGNGHGPESDDSMLTDDSDDPSPGRSTCHLFFFSFFFNLKSIPKLIKSKDLKTNVYFRTIFSASYFWKYKILVNITTSLGVKGMIASA